MSDMIPTNASGGASDPVARPADAARPPSSAAAAIPMGRLAAAFAVAAVADTLGAPLGEIGVVVFDVFVGLVLMAIVGFRRGFSPELVIATVLEAVPGLGVFPSWVAAVGVLAARSRFARGRPKA